MKSAMHHLLLLTCSLGLALPQGWCCVAYLAAAPVEEMANCCCAPLHPPAEQELPAPAARACCCGERDLASSQRVDAPAHADDLTVSFVPLDERSDSGTLDSARANAFSPIPPPCRIHVLRCVWLC